LAFGPNGTKLTMKPMMGRRVDLQTAR